DVIEFDASQVKVYVLFLAGGSGAAEIVDQELVVPNGVASVKMHHCVLQADIGELDLVSEKKPVGDIHFNGACVQQRILLVVFYQGALEQHAVEQRKVDVVDPYSGMQIA